MGNVARIRENKIHKERAADDGVEYKRKGIKE